MRDVPHRSNDYGHPGARRPGRAAPQASYGCSDGCGGTGASYRHLQQKRPRMVSMAVNYVRDTVTNLARQRRYDRWRPERALRIAYQATDTRGKVAKPETHTRSMLRAEANTRSMPRQQPDAPSTSDDDDDSSEDD